MEQSQAPAETISAEHLKRVLDYIQTELRALQTERAVILKRIGTIKQTIAGLADLFGPDLINGELLNLLSSQSYRDHRTHPGLTDFCRQLLRARPSDPLTVQEILVYVRQNCPAMLVHHKHPTNSLRMVLRRLVMYGEAVEVLSEKGSPAWKVAAVPVVEGDIAASCLYK